MFRECNSIRPCLSSLTLMLSSACAIAAVLGGALSGSAAKAQAAKAPAAKAKTVALPAGPGRDVVTRVCSGCHSIALVGARRDTPKGWQRTVDQMINLGATPTPAESDVVIAYLSKNLARQ